MRDYYSQLVEKASGVVIVSPRGSTVKRGGTVSIRLEMIDPSSSGESSRTDMGPQKSKGQMCLVPNPLRVNS